MKVIVDRYEVDRLLGRALFVPTNWHQSLSDRYWEGDSPDLLERLLRAGGKVSAQAASLTLNRIVAVGAHWACQGERAALQNCWLQFGGHSSPKESMIALGTPRTSPSAIPRLRS
ncbi:hypothetical protein [Roseateles sp. P5_E4]